MGFGSRRYSSMELVGDRGPRKTFDHRRPIDWGVMLNPNTGNQCCARVDPEQAGIRVAPRSKGLIPSNPALCQTLSRLTEPNVITSGMTGGPDGIGQRVPGKHSANQGCMPRSSRWVGGVRRRNVDILKEVGPSILPSLTRALPRDSTSDFNGTIQRIGLVGCPHPRALGLGRCHPEGWRRFRSGARAKLRCQHG
jgi:hypothetical protein